MSADKYELLKLIKKAAVEAVGSAYPCDFLFAVAKNVVTDENGNVTNFDACITDKLKPDIDFMVFGKAVEKNSIEENDKLILLRKSGGQLFYVMDRVGDDDAT